MDLKTSTIFKQGDSTKSPLRLLNDYFRSNYSFLMRLKYTSFTRIMILVLFNNFTRVQNFRKEFSNLSSTQVLIKLFIQCRY